MAELGIVHDVSELRKLILDNPELPICVMVGQDAASEDYGFTYCTDVRCHVGEILDYELPFGNGIIYTDRVDFREALEEYICDYDDALAALPDDEFKVRADAEDAKYEQYWKPAIIVIADN